MSVLCQIYLHAICNTQPNQIVKIVGNSKDLGNWDVHKGMTMITSGDTYPRWRCENPLVVPTNTILEFKIVVFENGNFKEWEQLPNNCNRKYVPKHLMVRLEMMKNKLTCIEKAIKKQHENKTIRRKVNPKFSPFDLADDDSEEMSSKNENVSSIFSSEESSKRKSFFLKSGESIYSSENASSSEPKHHKDKTKQDNDSVEDDAVTSLYNEFTKKWGHPQKKKKRDKTHQRTASNASSVGWSSNEEDIPFGFFEEINNLFTTVNWQDCFVICSFYLPLILKIDRKDPSAYMGKWVVKVGQDIFSQTLFKILHTNAKRFAWIGWAGFCLKDEEEKKNLQKLIFEKHSIFPVFFEEEKMFKGKLKGLCNGVNVSDLEKEMRMMMAYTEINKEIANQCCKLAKNEKFNNQKGEIFFITLDYHLMLVPSFLRSFLLSSPSINNYIKYKLGFFLPRPFHSNSLLPQMAFAHKLVSSLLSADILNFYSYSSAKNFTSIIEKMHGIKLQIHKGGEQCFFYEGRVILVKIEYPNLQPNFIENLLSCVNDEEEENIISFLSMDDLSIFSGIENKMKAFRDFVKQKKPIEKKCL